MAVILGWKRHREEILREVKDEMLFLQCQLDCGLR